MRTANEAAPSNRCCPNQRRTFSSSCHSLTVSTPKSVGFSSGNSVIAAGAEKTVRKSAVEKSGRFASATNCTTQRFCVSGVSPSLRIPVKRSVADWIAAPRVTWLRSNRAAAT